VTAPHLLLGAPQRERMTAVRISPHRFSMGVLRVLGPFSYGKSPLRGLGGGGRRGLEVVLVYGTHVPISPSSTNGSGRPAMSTLDWLPGTNQAPVTAQT
jgi:hypothetical protein